MRHFLLTVLPIFALFFLGGCAPRNVDKSNSIMSMQTIDRNGFTETISNKERISSFQETDFLTAQPFQKVLRIYGKNLQGQTTSKITTYHDNGGLYQYLEAVDGRAHGIYREWFPNGQKKIEATLIEGMADLHELAQNTWVFDGPCTVWNQEGVLLSTFPYSKGLLVGTVISFFPDGTIEQEIPYEHGEIDGVMRTFFEDHTLCEEIPYLKGVKNGVATAYWKQDQLKSKENYEKGLLQTASYWDEEGNLVAEVKDGMGKQSLFAGSALSVLTSIRNGIIEGEIVHFHPNGTVYNSYSLLNGKKQGEEWEYYPYAPGETRQSKLFLHWDSDKIQGIVKTWYPSGQIESQREFFDNKKQGSSFAWYKNGDLMLTEEYENDLLLRGVYYKPGDKIAVGKIESGKGVAHLYTPEGFFLKKVSYEKGKPVLQADSTTY